MQDHPTLPKPLAYVPHKSQANISVCICCRSALCAENANILCFYTPAPIASPHRQRCRRTARGACPSTMSGAGLALSIDAVRSSLI